MDQPPLEYEGPATRIRRPFFIAPAKLLWLAGCLAVLSGAVAAAALLLDLHDRRDWLQRTTLVAATAGVIAAAVALLRDQYRFRPAALLAITGGVLSLASGASSMFLPRLIIEREPAWRVQCASRLRQIGQALLLYSLDHGDTLPPDLGTLYRNVEDASADMFICPLSHDTPAKAGSRAMEAAMIANRGHCSYLYRGAGLKLTPIPSTTVIAYEPLSNHNGDGSNVLFTDGHVGFLTRAELAAALAASSATTAPAIATSPAATTAPASTLP